MRKSLRLWILLGIDNLKKNHFKAVFYRYNEVLLFLHLLYMQRKNYFEIHWNCNTQIIGMASFDWFHSMIDTYTLQDRCIQCNPFLKTQNSLIFVWCIKSEFIVTDLIVKVKRAIKKLLFV